MAFLPFSDGRRPMAGSGSLFGGLQRGVIRQACADCYREWGGLELSSVWEGLRLRAWTRRSVVGEVLAAQGWSEGGVCCAPNAWLTLAAGEVAGARCGLVNR